MDTLAHNLSSNNNGSFPCWTFDPCDEVHCLFGDGELQLIVLKCNDPIALQMVIAISRDLVWFDHTFSESDSVTVYYSSYKVVFNATIEHKSSGIAFQVCMYVKLNFRIICGMDQYYLKEGMNYFKLYYIVIISGILPLGSF